LDRLNVVHVSRPTASARGLASVAEHGARSSANFHEGAACPSREETASRAAALSAFAQRAGARAAAGLALARAQGRLHPPGQEPRRCATNSWAILPRAGQLSASGPVSLWPAAAWPRAEDGPAARRHSSRASPPPSLPLPRAALPKFPAANSIYLMQPCCLSPKEKNPHAQLEAQASARNILPSPVQAK
jgi:hypothetical protein